MSAETPSTDGVDDPSTFEIDDYLSKNRLHGVAIIKEKPKSED